MARIGVVGAGVAGLAAAIRLSAKGHDVEIFEANGYLGGKLTEYRQDGYRFDAGPSLFTMPHFLDAVFEAAGRDPRAYYHYRKIDPGCHYFWEDGTHFNAPASAKEFARKAEDTFKVPYASIIEYLGQSEKIFDLTEGVFLQRSLHKASTYLRWDTLRSFLKLRRARLWSTMHQVNHDALRNQKLTQLFDRYATFNGSDPYQAPGTLTVIPTLEHRWGTFLPYGGMHQITESLHRLAKDLGIKIHLNEPVDQIKLKGKKVTGLKTAKANYPFDQVVSNMDIIPTYAKLLPGLRLSGQIKKQERSSSALIFYWGIGREFGQLGLHNILWSEDYKREFEQLFQEKTIFDDPTVYINITSKHEPTDAPAGCENWFVMVNAPHLSGQDWEALIKKTRANIISKINRVLGADIEPLINTERILDPEGIQITTSSHLGSLYGTSSNNRMAAFLRHPNFKRSVKGLYFCGGSVHPGGGIPLCLLSAKIVSEVAG